MIYSILPQKNLSVSDIRDTLNGNGGTTDENVASLFKTSANINKWAKYKPESFEKDFNLDDDDRSDNNYGFEERSIGSGATISELFDKSISKELWQYVLPKGGEDSPYRLGDFRKYNPSATVPYNYKHVVENGTTVNNNYSQEQRVVINDDSELRIEDFGAFNHLSQGGENLYYFWIARIANGTNYDYIISNYTPVSGSLNNIDCTLNFNKTGTWECLFCVGRNDSSNDSNYIASRTDCLALPLGYKQFVLTKKTVTINVKIISPDYINDTQYDSGTYMLHFGSNIFYFNMTPSDTTGTIPDTEFKFGFYIRLINGMDVIDDIELYDEDTGDTILYNANKTDYMIVNFPTPIYLSNYFNPADLDDATELEIRPIMERVSSEGNSASFATNDVLHLYI